MPSISEFYEEVRRLSPKFTETKDDGSQEKVFFETKSNYENFCSVLKQYGMEFSVRYSCSSRANDSSRICWSSQNIPFFGKPFVIEKTSHLKCSNGPNYFKMYRLKDNTIQHDPPAKKRRFRVQPSKKMDCTAFMKVTRMKVYPEYKLGENVNKNLREKKGEVMKQLKNALKSDKSGEIRAETLYYVVFSKPTAHSHDVWTTFKSQMLDDELKLVIRNHVSEGITQIDTLKTLLQTYVRDNISKNIPSSARSFYPTNKTIYNYVLKFMYEMKASRIDQAALNVEESSHSSSQNSDISEFVVPEGGISDFEGIPPSGASELVENSVPNVDHFIQEIRNITKELHDLSFLITPDAQKYDPSIFSRLYENLCENRSLMDNLVLKECDSHIVTLSSHRSLKRKKQ